MAALVQTKVSVIPAKAGTPLLSFKPSRSKRGPRFGINKRGKDVNHTENGLVTKGAMQ
jgi:hypothetical protein